MKNSREISLRRYYKMNRKLMRSLHTPHSWNHQLRKCKIKTAGRVQKKRKRKKKVWRKKIICKHPKRKWQKK